jgi:hypothetical protein
MPLDDHSLERVRDETQAVLDEAVMDGLAERGYLLEEVILVVRGYAKSGGSFRVVRANIPTDKAESWDAPELLLWAAEMVAVDQGLVPPSS